MPFARQFGWGGLELDGWRGTGLITRVAPDRARFEDDGGPTVVVRPVGHRTVRPVAWASCG